MVQRENCLDTSCFLTSTGVPCGMYALMRAHIYIHTYTSSKYIFKRKKNWSGIYSNSDFPRDNLPYMRSTGETVYVLDKPGP